MQDALELKNAKGYRSKYINSLNEAVKQTRVVGGDVSPVETEGGTFLYTRGDAHAMKFQLFAGVAPLNGTNYHVRAVADGCFFHGGNFVQLLNAKGTHYVKGGLMPRGSGWYSDLAPTSSWSKCKVHILEFSGNFYMAFRYDETALWTLIEGATEGDESEIKIICTIGEWDYALQKATQYIASDIFYGGGGVVEEDTLQPWEIFSTTENGEIVWWVAHPQWELNAPYEVYPDGASAPIPEVAFAFEDSHATSLARDFGGVLCWKLTDSTASWNEGFTNVYAIINSYGNIELFTPVTEGTCVTDVVENPACIKIGKFTRDADGNITSWTQTRKGAIRSKWSETQPFFVEQFDDCGSPTIKRHTEAKTGLAEGTEMGKYSFWVLTTYINDREIISGEQLANASYYPQFPYPQYALFYGNYIWRYGVYLTTESSQIALIRDAETKPTLLVRTETLAYAVEQPFVERVQVVYPDTPLDQGSVDAVTHKVRVFTLDQSSTFDSTSNLFATESIDVTNGGILEVAQE